MMKDREGRWLWIVDADGGAQPVRRQEDISSRPRGRGLADWWVVAKDPGLVPEQPGSLLAFGQGPAWRQGSKAELAALDSVGTNGAGGANNAGGGGHTKIGAGGQPQLYDEHGRYLGNAGALGRVAEGVGQALRQGAAAAREALARAAHELRSNEDLHKGVEFGARAAAEVSKDVAKRAGMDAVGAYVGYRLKTDTEEPKPVHAIGTAGSLLLKGARLYEEAPKWATGLGSRIERIKREVYGKE